jgi:hypothetical protein
MAENWSKAAGSGVAAGEPVNRRWTKFRWLMDVEENKTHRRLPDYCLVLNDQAVENAFGGHLRTVECVHAGIPRWNVGRRNQKQKWSGVRWVVGGRVDQMMTIMVQRLGIVFCVCVIGSAVSARTIWSD